MTIALSIFVLFGLGVIGLLAVTVRQALPAISALRCALDEGRLPLTYRIRIAEPVRQVTVVALRADRKPATARRKPASTAIKPAAKLRRPAAAAAA